MLDRPFVSAVDADRMLDVLLMWRTSVRVDRYPTLYRLRMPLICSSRAYGRRSRTPMYGPINNLPSFQPLDRP